MTDAPTGWSTRAGTAETHGIVQPLQPGTVLAGRYEIIELLGEGGMGAVYKANDTELGKLVALKVIRPELANQPNVLRRFKQELILARQVTHRNVVRIFDLGVAEGLKFISMEFVEGQNLAKHVAAAGKLKPEEAAGIILQACRGLEAAHAEGVVHRDLKPQNIMLDQRGKVTVMDFGIARSAEVSGITRTGVVVGTPDYMSPEQARGHGVDARSDVFSLGIIFYELLTGARPFEADSALATLLRRTQEKARPPVELDATIPPALNDVVMKSLETEPARRYQSAREMAEDIEAWQATLPGARLGRRRALPQSRTWQWAGLAMLALVLVLAGLLFRERLRSRAPAVQPAVTLLISDFNNATAEPVFSNTLESMFALALEGASFITTFDRGEARRIAAQIRPSATALDEGLARLVALRQGVSSVLAGSIAPRAGGYLVSIRVSDTVTGNVIVSKELEVSSKEGVLAAVGKLAAPVRKSLGDATPESVQMSAAETFTSASLPAAHAYGVAQEFGGKGEWAEAIRHYQQAVQLEPNLGRAYAGMAVAYANQGLRAEAEKQYQLAMARLDRMTDREKYRTRGGYYLMVRNHQKAVEEFGALVGRYPADSAGLTGLALARFYKREMGRALEEGRRALAIYPNSVIKRMNVALYAMYAGDFKSADQELGRVLERNPTYAKAQLARGLCRLAQGQPEQAREAYKLLDGFPGPGRSFAPIGLADLALYEGRVADAIPLLETGAESDLAQKRRSLAAIKLAALAEACLLARRHGQAVAAADRAVATDSQDSVLFPAANVYIGCGQEAKAMKLANELSARVESDSRAYARLIRGEIRLKHSDAPQAIELFQEAQQIADTWLGRLHLGRAFLEAGKFTEAHSEFEICLRRRGESTAVFLDDLPTYRQLPQVHYYLGRAQQGLKSPAAADSYRTFLSMTKGDEHPLAAEARHRLAGKP